MLKIINHLYKSSLMKEYLYRFKYIIFESDDIDLVKKILLARFIEDLDENVEIEEFKFEKLNKTNEIENEETMVISQYQILWDKCYFENFK